MFQMNTYLRLILLVGFISCFSLSAQTTESINSGIDNVELKLKSSNVSSEVSNTINEQLDLARTGLSDSENFNSQLQQYEQDMLQAKSRLAELNQQQISLNKQTIAIADQNNSEQLANRLMVLNAKQNSLQADLDEQQKQKTRLSNRPTTISEEISSARNVLDSTRQLLEQMKPDGDLIATSARLALEAKIISLNAQITLLEREVATVPARQSLVDGQISLLNAQLENNKQHIDAIQSLLSKSRSGDASQILQQSQEAVSSATDSPVLQSLAQENLELANELQLLVETGPQIDNNVERLRQQRQDLQQSAQTVERILQTGQITDALGVLLHRLRSGLPQENRLQNRLEQLDEAIVNQQLNLILWQDKIRGMTAQNTAPSALSTQNNSQDNLSTKQLAQLQELNASQVKLLQQLIDSANSGIDQLTDEKLLLSEVKSKTIDLKTQLDRRLVWLPSYSKLSDNLIHNLAISVNWYLKGSAWIQVTNDLINGINKVPVYSLLVLFISIGIFSLRLTIKKSLKRILDRLGKVGLDTYWATPVALVETIILALPLPILIGAIAGLITIGTETGNFSNAIATALAAVSSLSFTLLFFRSLCRANGIFVGHFGWSNVAREKLGHTLTLFVWYQGFATFLFASAMASNQIELRYGIAILAFIAMSVGIAMFSFAFFKPKSGIAVSIVGHSKRSILLTIAFPVMVAAPLLIGLLPLIGFFDTAVELQSKLFQSIVVLIFVAIFYGILLRIFAVAFRRYRLRKLKTFRANQELQRAQQESSEASGEALPITEKNELPNDELIQTKMRRTAMGISSALFLIGLWFIWLPLLPALGIVNEIVLWQKNITVDGVDVAENVTLGNIILAIFFFIGGFQVARNSRGILEVSFFDRVSLDPGARYAATALLGYVILGTGIVIGFSQLGIDWSKLQWIVAALGVGLGFGLQEIVANFVSGLIILFERPVRVGDVVTIGNLSGTVSNIKIRATTITDFENRDVILPNKSIITENVTNWTLGNAITRILINIGVAYGSDTRQVRDILMAVLDGHPDVLKLPAPSVFFINHGESSLDFEIRVFVETTAKRLPVTHELNTLINETLTENGFEIPFPQRDLHIIQNSAAQIEPQITKRSSEL